MATARFTDTAAVTPEDDAAILCFSRSVYEKEALLRAAYRVTDRYILEVEPFDEAQWVVRVRAREETRGHAGGLRRAGDDLRNEVIDQQIRLDLDRRFGALREIIVSHAFSPVSERARRR